MKLRRLGPTDAAYFAADPQPLEVALLRFVPRADGSLPSPDAIVEYARHALTRADVSPAVEAGRQRVRRVPGDVAPPFWEDDPDFDASHHVRIYEGPNARAGVGDLLLDTLSRPFDLDRPLWRIEVVPSLEGTDDFGVLSAQHHAMGEGGWSLALLAQFFLSLTPEPHPVSSAGEWRPAGGASGGRALGAALAERVTSVTTGLSGVRAITRLAPGSATGEIARFASYFHDRSVKRSRARPAPTSDAVRMHVYRLSLLETRVASRAFAATITDLLLAATGAAWSAVDPDATEAWIAMPASLRAPGDDRATNRLGLASVCVPCHEDLLTTLRAAQASSSHAKQHELARTSADLTLLRSHVPGLSRRGPWGAGNPEILVSNMPGFPFQFYCHGSPLDAAWGASSLPMGCAGKLTFVTFGDLIHGTLIERLGSEGSAGTFDVEFGESLAGLFRIAGDRSLLARQPHFLALSPDRLDDLTRHARAVSFRPDDAIVTQGEVAGGFYVIRSGSASVSVDGEDRGVLGAGAGFGEVALLRGDVRQATVTALDQVEALCIDAAAFSAVFGSDPVNLRPLQAIVDSYESG